MSDADVIVIGTGMGGATFGHALARQGRRVLFLEKGHDRFTNPAVIDGEFAENRLPRVPPTPAERTTCYRNAGRYTEEIADLAHGGRTMIPFIGTGVGGSSGLYGAGLSRFARDDFRPRGNFPDALDAALPAAWPIDYDDLEPHYAAAEKLYEVAGEADPFLPDTDFSHYREPPPMSRSAAEVFEYLRVRGLKPYRLPIACEPTRDCAGCTGFLCPRSCKRDAGTVCLKPALTQYGANLLADCEVLRLETTGQRVTGVVARQDGREVTLRAPLVALAAGGLESPRILLNSHSPAYPSGLANMSGLVGRHLMRHYVDVYLLQPKVSADWHGNPKEIAFNDYCFQGSDRLGIAHSAGNPVDPDVVFTEMHTQMARYPGGALLGNLLRPLLRPAIRRHLQGKLFMFSIMEDLPYPENYVRPAPGDPARLELNYEIQAHDRARIARFRTVLLDLFKPYKPALLKRAEANDMLAHVCGTCRMGDDPGTSVVDRWNRAHGLDNLYIVDASFFPSSSAAHPSLTIAANSLRVAAHLA
ncbi:MAG: GMC oxidoreductase [Gammaproteobacteria bacterium]